ncbi:MAG: hypothetical protein RJA46_1462, partial [Pseudomonadota bacterium]
MAKQSTTPETPIQSKKSFKIELALTSTQQKLYFLLVKNNMTNLSLNHFSIRSLEIEKTTQFYSEVLGLTVGPRPEFPFPGVWLYNGDENDWANAVLHLIAIDKNDPNGLKQYLGERDPS